MLPLRSTLGVLNVAQLYLILTFILTVTIGPGPGAFAAVAAVLVFDFCFIPPYYTFTPYRSDHVLVLFAFLIVALVTGRLVARIYAEMEAVRTEQRRTAELVEFTGVMIGKPTREAIMAAIVEEVVRISGVSWCRVLLYDEHGQLTQRAVFPETPSSKPTPHELTTRSDGPRAAHTPAARRPPRGPRVRSIPIATGDHVAGALEIGADVDGGFSEDDNLLFAGFASQTMLALERARLLDEAARSAALEAADQLKSALLDAVSHDLRTPLATIRAAATALLDPAVRWDEEDRQAFLQVIDSQAQRLSLLVGNLLDLSRIEGGALRSEKAWSDAAELIGDVAVRLAQLAGGHPVATEVEPDLPKVCFDPVQIAQVLMNLGENAITYTPTGTRVTLAARAVPGAIEFAVRDAGPGIPAERQPHLFEKFYRIDAVGPGIGLGLVICKGLVEAHAGRIWVESEEGAGATFRFTIPLAEEGSAGVSHEW
jgi:two-component system sensor histidine kinase KdpD